MKALLRRVYRGIKKIPVIGPLSQKIVEAIKACRHPTPLKGGSGEAVGSPMEREASLLLQLNSLMERIAVLEQIKPAMNNYVTSWAEAVSLIRREQEALKSEIERLSAIVEKQSRDVSMKR